MAEWPDSLINAPPLRRDRSGWWVSKSDTISYDRCPWAFWLIDSGQLSAVRVLNDLAIRRLVDDGIAFESQVRDSAGGADLGGDQIASAAEVRLDVPVLENANLGIYGRPDGVVLADGGLQPIEIKSHTSLCHRDQIELCFYWMLLEPWRHRSAEPSGLLILRNDPTPQTIQVPLTDELFQQTQRLIDGVRRARVEPPPSRVCRCPVCARIERQRVFEECRARKDLTLIWGLGRVTAETLEGAGIQNYAQLMRATPARIHDLLSRHSLGVSEKAIAGWIHHAEAFEQDRPVFFGDRRLDLQEFIALDLEYDTLSEGSPIWLIGAAVVGANSLRTQSWWADPGEEAAALSELTGLLHSHPTLRVVTWNGDSADLPMLTKAYRRAGMHHEATALAARHFDLYRYVRDSLRFPLEGLRLKLVGAQLGLVRDPHVQAGLDATMAWHRYLRLRGSTEAAELKARLTQYNTDDLSFLVEITRALRSLTLSCSNAVH